MFLEATQKEPTLEELLEAYNIGNYTSIQARYILPKVAEAMGFDDANDLMMSPYGILAAKSFRDIAVEKFGEAPETPGVPNSDTSEWNQGLDKEGKLFPQAQKWVDEVVQLIVYKLEAYKAQQARNVKSDSTNNAQSAKIPQPVV